MSAQPQTVNSYNVFKTNNKGNDDKPIYQNNNLILLNAIEIAKSNKGFNAFTLNLTKDPNFISSNNKFKQNLSSSRFYKRYDVGEVLRGDFSKMFFDIDAHEEQEAEAIKAFTQINEMIEILNQNEHCCRLCGIIEYNNNIDIKYVEEIKELFNLNDCSEFLDNGSHNNIYVVENKNLLGKTISSHLFVAGCYFSRETLQQLFKSFNSANKLQNTDFAKVFDFTVYKAKQQILRFCLSGKGVNSRPPNQNFDNDFCGRIVSSINDFVATKTETDNVLIHGETLELLKTYINSKRFTETKDKDLLKRIKNKTQGIEDDLTEVKPRILYTAQKAWYFEMCESMAYDIVFNPELTNEELIEKYDNVNHYYFSNSQQKHVRNLSAINAAIEAVREKGPHNFIKCVNKGFEKLRLEKEDVFKFTLKDFKTIVNFGVNIQTLAILINGTFCFFDRSDDKKRADEFIAYVNSNNEITTDNIKRFLSSLRDSGFMIKLNRNVEGVNLSVKIDMLTAFKCCQGYKNTLKDFDVCSLEGNVLNLYNKPTKSEPVELCDEWKTIVELFSTEQNENFENVVNMDKYEYVLNWFAYALQHPDSRNKTILFISGMQGLGKNILTDCICKFLNGFGASNVNIDDVCGSYNGLVANKKLCVINELENSSYSDKIKTLIDDEQKINVKFGNQYITVNKCNYVIFSNHFNTNIIQKGDRRFAFIASTATPEEKSFYASMFQGDNLREEIYENLINHLLSRDLSNYRNNEAPLFDKVKVYEDMDLKRSPAYLETINIMKSRQNEPIELNELVEELVNRQEDNDDLRGININIRTLRKILSFNDTDDYKITQKHGGGYYVVYRYKEGSKTAKQIIIDYMEVNNLDKLEVNEAVKILTDAEMKGITSRTIRKTLSFNDEDNYEIKKSHGSSYIKKI